MLSATCCSAAIGRTTSEWHLIASTYACCGTKSASRSSRACQYEAQPSFMICVANTG